MMDGKVGGRSDGSGLMNAIGYGCDDEIRGRGQRRHGIFEVGMQMLSVNSAISSRREVTSPLIVAALSGLLR